MKNTEFNRLTVGELKVKLQDNLEELENLRFQKALQQVNNPMRIHHLRKEIARTKTLLREFELAIRK